MWCAAICLYVTDTYISQASEQPCRSLCRTYTHTLHTVQTLGWPARVWPCMQRDMYTHITTVASMWDCFPIFLLKVLHVCVVVICMRMRVFCSVVRWGWIHGRIQLMVQRSQIDGRCIRSAGFSGTDALFLCASGCTCTYVLDQRLFFCVTRTIDA
jgi:hypothetical protein